MSIPDPPMVTTNDGAVFRCYVDGSEWKFTHVASGKTYVGPAYRPITNEHELRALVVNWWTMERALRQ